MPEWNVPVLIEFHLTAFLQSAASAVICEICGQ